MASNNIVECPETREEFNKVISNNKSKIIIVKASAEWCNPCKRTAPIVDKLFETLPSNKLLIKLDIDDSENVASYLKIRKLPTFISYINGEKTDILLGSDVKQITNFFNKCKQYGSLKFNNSF